jgi:heptosyltransferase III
MDSNSRNTGNFNKRILIYRLGSLGDFVVALPCLHLIRRSYPQAHIVLLTNHPVSGKAAPAMQILDGSGICDESIGYPVGVRNPGTLVNLRRQIKSYSFDLAVLLNGSRGRFNAMRDWLFFRACGIPEIIGLAMGKEDMPMAASNGLLVEQECSRLARRVNAIDKVDLANRANWSLNLTGDEREKASILLKHHGVKAPFLITSVGTKLLAKDWGNENWIQLFEKLSLCFPELGLVMVGARDEFERSDQVRQSWKGKSYNFCGQCSPRISGAVFEQAVLYVGHDSGPMHLAASVGIPTVGIFSWHNPPGQWFPGYLGWENIKVFYPELPENGWHENLRLLRGVNQGVLKIRPDSVAQYCIGVLRSSCQP